tara:strand:- start:7501 stop:8472 length:972 start_codon:yes stop_codon:yes gene_type:complete
MSKNSNFSPKEIGKAILNSPVEYALQILGDKCTLLILKNIWLGRRKFEDFITEIGVSRGTLSSRLKFLVDHGVIYKDIYQSAPRRFEYKLTDKGLSTYPIASYLWQWNNLWTENSDVPSELIHTKCDNYLDLSTNCLHCNEDVKIEDVAFEVNLDQKFEKLPLFKTRRSENSSIYDSDLVFRIEDLLGDRWTGLVYAGLLYGLKRFDEFNEALGISTNILADRLKKFLDAGVIKKDLYQHKPARYEYRLTRKGRSGYLTAIHLHFWAHMWMLNAKNTTISLIHKPCGNMLKIKTVCKACNGEVDPSNVSISVSTSEDVNISSG